MPSYKKTAVFYHWSREKSSQLSPLSYRIWPLWQGDEDVRREAGEEDETSPRVETCDLHAGAGGHGRVPAREWGLGVFGSNLQPSHVHGSQVRWATQPSKRGRGLDWVKGRSRWLGFTQRNVRRRCCCLVVEYSLHRVIIVVFLSPK